MYNSVPRSVSPSSSPAANRSPSPSGSGAIRGQVSSPSLTRTYVPPHPPSSPSSGMTGGDSRIPRTGSGASPSPKYSSPRDRESRLQEKKDELELEKQILEATSNPEVYCTSSPDRPSFVTCVVCGREFTTHSFHIHIPQCLRKRSQMPKSERPNLLSTEQLVKAQEEGKTGHDMWKASLPECPNCGRTFKAEALSIHLRSCTPEKPMKKFNPNRSIDSASSGSAQSSSGRPSTASARSAPAETSSPAELPTQSLGGNRPSTSDGHSRGGRAVRAPGPALRPKNEPSRPKVTFRPNVSLISNPDMTSGSPDMTQTPSDDQDAERANSDDEDLEGSNTNDTETYEAPTKRAVAVSEIPRPRLAPRPVHNPNRRFDETPQDNVVRILVYDDELVPSDSARGIKLSRASTLRDALEVICNALNIAGEVNAADCSLLDEDGDYVAVAALANNGRYKVQHKKLSRPAEQQVTSKRTEQAQPVQIESPPPQETKPPVEVIAEQPPAPSTIAAQRERIRMIRASLPAGTSATPQETSMSSVPMPKPVGKPPVAPVKASPPPTAPLPQRFTSQPARETSVPTAIPVTAPTIKKKDRPDPHISIYAAAAERAASLEIDKSSSAIPRFHDLGVEYRDLSDASPMECKCKICGRMFADHQRLLIHQHSCTPDKPARPVRKSTP